jgi:lipopolysaccharide heptosyltransferase I
MRIAAENVAVVKLGAIGDAVNSLPFVNRLRDGLPRARITWIIGPRAHALLEGHAAVDEFLVIDTRDWRAWPRFIRELRRRRFDLVIDLQRILKSGLIARASGAPLRLGFDRARSKELSWLFMNRAIPANPRPGVTVEQYLEFADYLELPRSEARWDLPLGDEHSTAASGARKDVVPSRDRGREKLVIVNLGASKPANRWSPEQWAELCRRLSTELGCRVQISGGAEDRAVAEQVIASSRVPIDDLVGRSSLKETARVIRSARLFIGCDTGPLHIAVAVRTPCVSLYGASDPARTGPFGETAGIVSKPAPCSPCRRRHCNVPGHPCMRELAVDLVLARARTLLSHEPSSS